jgi:hypothetical protein
MCWCCVLQVPNIALNPTLDGIQNAINSTAKAILQASGRLRCWGMVNGPPTYHDLIARDKEVVKSVLLLTGSIEHIKQQVAEYLATFDKYSFLWTQDLQVGAGYLLLHCAARQQLSVLQNGCTRCCMAECCGRVSAPVDCL